MQEIADANGIGVATLFRYFPKKDNLIVAVAVQHEERTLEAFDEIVQLKASAFERLEKLLDFLLDNTSEQKQNDTKFREAFESYAAFKKEPLTDIDIYIQVQKQIMGSLQPIIEDAKVDGSIRQDISAKETITTIINTYGTFGNNVALKAPISYLDKDIEPHTQQHVLKEMLLAYIKPI